MHFAVLKKHTQKKEFFSVRIDFISLMNKSTAFGIHTVRFPYRRKISVFYH